MITGSSLTGQYRPREIADSNAAAVNSSGQAFLASIETEVSNTRLFNLLQTLRTIVSFPPEASRSVERETGIEPATNSLEGCDSTTELLPP